MFICVYLQQFCCLSYALIYFLYEHACHNYSFIISIESLIKDFTAVLFSYIISLHKNEDTLWQNVKNTYRQGGNRSSRT